MNLLVVDTDSRTSDFLKSGLKAEGYCVDTAHSGKEALLLASTLTYQLMILDILLADVDGRDVIRRLRATDNAIRVLILSASDSVQDKVSCLRLGADDYVTKPFSFSEIAARTNALLRRAGDYHAQSPRLVVGDLAIDREAHTVTRAGKRITLTATEFSLLEFLATTPGRPFSRARILEHVWGYDSDPLTNIVEVYISHLRRKIDAGHSVKLIRNVRTVGYTVGGDE